MKLLSALAIFTLTCKVHATCPPIIPCKPAGKASTIAGSNADIKLIEMAAKMTTDTKAVSKAVIDAAKAQSAAMNKGATSLTAVMMEVTQTNIEKKQQMALITNDAAMAHDADIAEREVRRKSAVVSDDDIKAEFVVILNTLNNFPDKTVPFVIDVLIKSYDENPDGYVNVPIKESQGVCEQSDIDEGKCGTPQRAFLGSKLTALFEQCSAIKKSLVMEKRESASQATEIAIVNKKQKEVGTITNSNGAIQSRVSEANEDSCAPSEFKAGICNIDLSEADYQEALMIGAKVPNGDVLAANFTNPSDTYIEGYLDDLDPEMLSDIENAALDRDILELNPEQTVVDIVDTYRNANQVKAAMSFMDNIVGDDLVANMPLNQRRDPGNAIVQARYLQRMSGLSMVRTSMTDSMMKRVGEKMNNYINTGKISEKFNITIASPDHKESVAGAGTLDSMKSRVADQMSQFSLTVDGSEGQADFVNAASMPVLQRMQLEALKLNNEILFERYLISEQRVSLKAIQVSQQINSKANVDKLNAMRSGRN